MWFADACGKRSLYGNVCPTVSDVVKRNGRSMTCFSLLSSPDQVTARALVRVSGEKTVYCAIRRSFCVKVNVLPKPHDC